MTEDLSSNSKSYTSNLSMEQMQWLFKILSTEDRKRLNSVMKDCTSEMTLTRGLPLAALVVGGMYYVRNRLPPELRLGKRNWPIYLISGFGSITLANLLTVNTCAERVRPVLMELYNKYNVNTPSSITYDKLRSNNRNQFVDVKKNINYNLEKHNNFDKNLMFSNLTNSNYNLSTNNDEISTKNLPNVELKRDTDLTKLLGLEDMSVMSGTPYQSSTDQFQTEFSNEKRNVYNTNKYS